MSRWFRMYDEMLDDPKVQMLSPELFKTWVNLLCVASRNAGGLPTTEKLSFALRVSAHEMQSRIDELTLLGLLDIRPDKSLEPHNWPERQFTSDTSVERTRKYRERLKKKACDVTVTPAVTPPDTDTDTDKHSSTVLAAAAREPCSAAAPPDDFLDRLTKAAEPCLDNPANCMGLLTSGVPTMWLNQGCDLELDILPVLRAAAVKYRGKRIRDWGYFTAMITEAKARRERGLPSVTVAAPKKQPASTFAHPKRRDEEREYRDHLAWAKSMGIIDDEHVN